MPIDPQIPLAAHGMGPLVNPLELVQQAEQIRTQRENARALAEQRQAIAEQRQAQTAKLQREAERETMGNAGLEELFTTYEPGKPIPTGAVGKMYRGYGPEKTSAIVKGLMDFHTADLTNADGVRKSMYTRVVGLKALPEDRRAAAYDAVTKDYIAKGVIRAEEVAPYSPTVLDDYEQQLMTPEQRANARKPVNAPPPGQSLLDPKTHQPIYTSPEKVTHSAALVEFQDAVAQGYKGTFEQYQTADANRKRPVTNINSGGGATDAKDIASAIVSGDQPPDLKALYRLGGPVRAELARQGYNLTNASLDWQATQKHVATLNGSKITTLMASVKTAKDSLGVIQSLADKWQGGRFPLLNRVNLKLAMNGAYGKEAATIATQLEGQITDVTSELGQVYMGGNSPTDHALKLAEKNLRGEWDQKVLADMIKLAETNLTIRENSYKHSVPLGTGDSNAYAQPPQGATPAAAGPERKPIPGIPGGIAELRNGKWIRIQ